MSNDKPVDRSPQVEAVTPADEQAAALVGKINRHVASQRRSDGECLTCGHSWAAHFPTCHTKLLIEAATLLGERRPPAPDVAALIAKWRDEVGRARRDLPKTYGNECTATAILQCADQLEQALGERSRTEAPSMPVQELPTIEQVSGLIDDVTGGESLATHLDRLRGAPDEGGR